MISVGLIKPCYVNKHGEYGFNQTLSCRKSLRVDTLRMYHSWNVASATGLHMPGEV